MKLDNSRLRMIERRHRGKRRGTLIVRQSDDADLYHGDGVTYTGSELDRLSADGVQVIVVAYQDETPAAITGENGAVDAAAD